jgi:hypothetical protein
MSWDLLQDERLAEGGARVTVVEIALPGGTKKYAFGPGVTDLSGGLGQYLGTIVSGGLTPTSRSILDPKGALADVEITVTVDDSDGALAALAEGSQALDIVGSAVVKRQGSLRVKSKRDYADLWMETFRGVVASHGPAGLKKWRFTCRQDDVKLRSREFPFPVIDGADFPNAPATSLAQYGPLVWGKHSSDGTSQKGAIPLVKVCGSASPFDYLAAWGRLLAVDAVYADGVKQSTGWSVSYQVKNSGRLATIITFTSDQGSKAITADVRGYDSNADGSGSLIENPIDFCKHLVVNWIVNDYKSGSWYAESTAPLDLPMLSRWASYYTRTNARASRRIFASTRSAGKDLMNEIAKDWGFRLFWTNSGKIAATVIDPSVMDLGNDEMWFRSEGEGKGFEATPQDPDVDSQLNKVTVEALYGEADGKFFRSLEVFDPKARRKATDTLQLPSSAAYYY